jgi:DNA/RNA-binding domain of Phe-tRNA-synthetase-like protein
MQINFSSSIKEKIKSVRLGIIEFTSSVSPSSRQFWNLVDKESNSLRQHIKSEMITTIPAIASTRKAYKLCGKDPSRYRPSADSLIRRIVKGNDLYKVNDVVDVLNFISLKSGFSIGGYCQTKIEGLPFLDIGKSTDEYYGIGRGLLNIEGLPVLRDDKGVFGSPTSDSKRTMITEEAKQIVFVFFDFEYSPILNETLINCKELLKQYCNTDDLQISYCKL